MSGASAGDALAASPYLRSLGVAVEEAGDDRTRVRVPYREENANAGGVLHGGVIASAIDAAGVLVARAGADLGPDVAHGTLDLSVAYLAPAVGEAVVAEARVQRRGREIVYAAVDLGTDEGKLVATGLLTYRIGAPGVAASRRTDAMPAAASSPGDAAQLARLFTTSPFIGRLGVRVTQAAAGTARLVLPAGDGCRDAGGAVHEGTLAALLDTAGAVAAWSLVPLDARNRASTVGLHVSLHEPAHGDVDAEARVLHGGDEILASRVTLGSGGRVVATGAVTYRLVTPES